MHKLFTEQVALMERKHKTFRLIERENSILMKVIYYGLLMFLWNKRFMDGYTTTIISWVYMQKRFFNTARLGTQTASKLMVRYKKDLQNTSNAVREIAHRFLQVVQNNKAFNKGIKAVFRMSQALSGNLRDAMQPLLKFFGKVLQASEPHIKRMGDAFEKWAKLI